MALPFPHKNLTLLFKHAKNLTLPFKHAAGAYHVWSPLQHGEWQPLTAPSKKRLLKFQSNNPTLEARKNAEVNSITIAKLKLLVLNPRKQLHGLAYKGAFGSLDDACFACLDKEDQGIGCLARYLGFCNFQYLSS